MNLWSEGSARASDCCSCANVVGRWSRVLEGAIGHPLIVMCRVGRSLLFWLCRGCELEVRCARGVSEGGFCGCLEGVGEGTSRGALALTAPPPKEGSAKKIIYKKGREKP